MNLQKEPHIPDSEIDQLKKLFPISLDICREKALQLISHHPRNLIVLQVLAACESLLKNYPRAIELYQTCLDIDPNSIAFLNNFAWNHIEIEDYHMAATLLNDIKQKWNHPAIYFNLAVTYERGKVTNPALLVEAVNKMELYRQKFPSFQQPNQKGLIHTFQLNPQQNYDLKQIKQFQKDVFQSVIFFQNMLHAQLDMDKITQILQKLHPKVVRKMEQQNKYGIRIENPIKAIIEVMQGFRQKIVPFFNREYRKEINQYLIESIRMLNSNIFEGEINKDCDYEQIRRNLVLPCVIQLEETAKDISAKVTTLKNLRLNSFPQHQKPISGAKQVYSPKKIPIEKPVDLDKQASIPVNHQVIVIEDDIPIQDSTNHNYCSNFTHPVKQKKLYIPPKAAQVEDEQLRVRKQMDKEIKREERQELDGFERDDLPADVYNFYIRLNDIEQMIIKQQKHLHSILRVQKNSISNPIFIILHLKINDTDIFNVYLNQTRIKNEIQRQPTLPNLSNLTDPSQINQIIKYYHFLNIVLMFYNFYGTHNFQYQLKTVPTNLQLTHFVDLVTPVINHMFEEDDCFGDTKLGWLFNQIHHGLAKYFHYTTSKQYLERVNTMLRRISQICDSEKQIVESFINDILAEKHRKYREILLSRELTEINGSTKEHFYFNWKLNRYHLIHKRKSVRYAFKDQDNWIISNVCLLLITLSEKELQQEDEGIICEAFTDCFHQSGQIFCYKQQILDKFYISNHAIPMMQKAGVVIRKFFRDIISL